MGKQTYSQKFLGGLNTVLAPKLMGNDQYIYMLNCDITATADGNLGVVTNLKGNVSINVELPEGENKTIYSLSNEESGKMYFAVWNSEGFHSWYELDYRSKTVTLIIQSRTDTGGEDIFQWPKGVLINSANLVGDNLLYWTMEGQPARKINIAKAKDKSLETGYGDVIFDETTRAYKQSPGFAPAAAYFTDSDKKSNRVFRKLFKFATRFIYDDKESSVFSDFSRVAVPAEEDITGTKGVPLINNGISVKFTTGSSIVKKIELIMQSTTDDRNVFSDWVSVGVFDKEILSIGNNTEYEYKFYNDVTYLAIDQNQVNQQQSDLPDNPQTQEFAYNTIVYGNYSEGFPAVKVDLGFGVVYSDLFVPSGQENVLNNPSIQFNLIEHYRETKFLSGYWLHTVGEIIIGPDVKAGNIFKVDFTNISFSREYKASLTDSAQTVASYFRTQFTMMGNMNSGGGYVNNVVAAGGGSYKFQFRVWNHNRNPNYIGVNTSATPVNYSKLKDTGNSVPNEKLGSSRRYGIRYENQDGKRSLTYGGDNAVSVKTINELGGIKKVEVVIDIKHKAPEWARRYSIMATKNLNPDYIQLLIQRVSKASELNGEEYQDLIIGSLSTFKKVHPNATLGYEFKKGDRVRLVKNYSGSAWTVPSSVIDYEVLDYLPEYRYDVNENVELDGTLNVKITGTPDSNNIGNNIIINGTERTIVGVGSDTYILDSALVVDGASTTNKQTYPAYEIINRNGILRIKANPSYPITVNPSTNTFALVEVFTPGTNALNAEHENYYDTGYKFEIYEDNGVKYHRGNSQDQTASQSAKVTIGGFDNYVRNRELITNNSEKNPQSIITSIEDSSYSDFYRSNLSSLGRPSRLDDSRGVVQMDDSLIWSNSFIEDTNINGLNMFLSTNRVDYNDKYGSVEKILFYEGRLYVFKHLKTGWVPVMGNIMADSEGQSFVGLSTRLLPNKMEYFLWDGGVGNNSESIVKYGNSIFFVSPTSQVIIELGGAGVIPTSKQYGIDNYARKLITAASTSGAHIFGGINRKKNQYIVMISPYSKIAYKDNINQSNTGIIETDVLGNWSIVFNPANGSAVLSGNNLKYTPNVNFSGIDNMSYKSGNGLVRNIAVSVLAEETETVWKPDGEYCVTSSGSRTGFVAYSTLLEYDVLANQYTGNSKPNISSDPNYVAPVEDLIKCPIGVDFVSLGFIRRSINAQTITGSIQCTGSYNVVIKDSENYSSGSTIVESGVKTSGSTYSLSVPQNSGNAYLFLVVSGGTYDQVLKLSINNAYLISFNSNSLVGLTELSIDSSAIPTAYGNIFNSLSINQCLALTKLTVKGHNLASLNLSVNTLLSYIDLSKGYDLTSLQIGNWGIITTLDISECKFTQYDFSTSFIDTVIATYNSSITSGSGRVLKYGVNNSSGIYPSPSVKSSYDSLVSKGVSVIGRSPVVSTSATISLIQNHANDEIFAKIVLSRPLSVNLSATIRGSYRSAVDGRDYQVREIMMIYAGETESDSSWSYSDVISSTNLSISSVDPNPAAGVVVNITYPL